MVRETDMKRTGFTLIELLITLVILGILAAIALPSYRAYILKSRRIEATSTLTQIQMAEEKYRGNNLTYASLALLGFPARSTYYTFTVTADGDEYTLNAVAIGDQANDSDCTNLSIIQGRSGVLQTPATCWK